MSNTKTVDGMRYEATGSKKINNRQVSLQAANNLGTVSLVWLLVKRHKVVILALGNVILVLNWALPQWVEIVKSIFN